MKVNENYVESSHLPDSKRRASAGAPEAFSASSIWFRRLVSASNFCWTRIRSLRSFLKRFWYNTARDTMKMTLIKREIEWHFAAGMKHFDFMKCKNVELSLWYIQRRSPSLRAATRIWFKFRRNWKCLCLHSNEKTSKRSINCFVRMPCDSSNDKKNGQKVCLVEKLWNDQKRPGNLVLRFQAEGVWQRKRISA